MSINEKFGEQAVHLWNEFITKEKLTEAQARQFEQYMLLLCQWNDKINLTRIIDLPEIVAYHFQDSMRIRDTFSFATMRGVCDVGSGAGFPGIPLKILYPSVPFILLEVNNKKVAFLQEVIDQLELPHITVSNLDWRTFLRQTAYEIDVVMARASLQLEELVRVFKPVSPYRNAQLIYWASKHWKPGLQEQQFMRKQVSYEVGNQQRNYIFFADN